MKYLIALMAALLATLPVTQSWSMTVSKTVQKEKPANFPVATLAGGCFWCIESDIRKLDGVLFTEVGYMGGTTEKPTYEDVSTGKTGHAEVIQITYDPAKITYDKILEYFMTVAHDPTQKNRQGVDVGTQYRSAVFYHDDMQKTAAEKLIARLTADKKFSNPIVTTLEPAATFWQGENYHQQYYEKYEDKTGEKHIRVQIKEQKRKLMGQ